MKCEECLQDIEEYFDGEIEEPTAVRLSAHLASCSACATAAEALRLETEAYRRYDRPIAVTPAMWPAIKARIENETPSRTPLPGVNPFGWLAGAFNLPRLAPTLAAIALIALGSSFGVMYFKRAHETEPERVRIDSSIINPHSGNDIAKATEANTGAIASQTNTHGDSSGKSLSPRREIVRHRKSIKGDSDHLRSFAAETVRANVSGQNNQLRTQAVKAARSVERAPALNEFASAGSNPSVDSGDPDAEWRTHAERAQILLRSLRNVPLTEGPAKRNPTIDVAYERRQSKKLLYDNIVLRREAARRGDRSTERLLDNLEPILLDIANLPERPLSGDVRSIEGRMRKEEIVARLQAQSLSARNSFD
ncbi:MAG: zf-HC2 domain-containing protein [Pyrinomonadaceae bacterium]|nr:zf-HC2 domain-containing protein [Pyrinomonadaceae bacterium]